MAIIMADTNFLVELVDNNQGHAFIQKFKQQGVKIGLPTPVLAEFMVRDENDQRTAFLTQTNSLIRIFDFDKKSAIISAKMMRKILPLNHPENKSDEKWDRQVVKMDVQIVAITVANGIRQLYSRDDWIIKVVQRLDLPLEVVDFLSDSVLSQQDLFNS